MTGKKIQINPERDLRLDLFKVLHFLLSIAIFFFFWVFFRYDRFTFWTSKDFRYNYYLLVCFGILFYFLAETYNAYLLGYYRIRSLMIAQFLSQLITTAFLYVVTAIAWAQIKIPFVLFLSIPVYLALDCVWSLKADHLFFRFNPPCRTVLFYGTQKDRDDIMSMEGKALERLYKIRDEICTVGLSADEVINTADRYDAVVFHGINPEQKEKLLTYCVQNDKTCFFMPTPADAVMMGGYHIKSFTSPVLKVRKKKVMLLYAIVKRAFDIFASFCGIIVLSPFMLFAALLIKLYDGGPVLYKQVRLTKDGREFKILKFRSMRVDAEKDGIARLSTGEKDPRITPVGRFIRACRFDELPQLFNIIKGDMSVVGPRPERPEIAAQYCKELPEFSLRLQVKAGLTGYAQVYGKYNTDPAEKLKFDLLYIKNMDMLTDLKLMFSTFAILFSKESTEGVSEKQTTAISI